MTTSEDEITPGVLAERLDALTDLFKRRLLDDRTKQAVIEDLQNRLTVAEKAASAMAVKPIVDGLSLLVERLRSINPDDEYHIISELEYVLESVIGVTPITALVGDSVDRIRHEVISASGDGAELSVIELVRVGYEKDGVVLRPAKIVARRGRVDDDASSEGHEDG